MVKHVLRKAKHRLGFTMMEVLLVIGIIGITAAIAIPSLLSVHRNTQLRKHDDYAKAIYLAAQDNLNQMRASGELSLLTDAADGLEGIAADPQALHMPATVSSSKYQYSYSQMMPDAETKNPSYDLIVPGTVDNTIRNQHVIIEYNPKNGVVYSVFYYNDDNILDLYNDPVVNAKIRGGEDVPVRDRRTLGVGYYSAANAGSMENTEFVVVRAASILQFHNEQRSYVSVRLPMTIKDQNIPFFTNQNRYINGLEVTLTVTGEHGGSFTKTYISNTAPSSEDSTATPIPFFHDNAAFTVYADIPLDTLRSGEGFTQKAENQDPNTASNLIAAGDNITITADVTFYPSPAGNEEDKDDPIVMIESSSLAGINPMFHALTRDPQAEADDTSPYILSISNGRHLQNLAYLTPAFADKIKTIVFTYPEGTQAEAGSAPVLNWAETAAYYSAGSSQFSLKPIDFSGVSSSTNPAVRKMVIDGNDVSIENLYVDQATNGNAGLFGDLSNVEIKNIHLENPDVSANTATATGALAGTVGNVSIRECSVANPDDTTAISGKGKVGGLVGHVMSATKLSDCETGARVNGNGGTNPCVGGLVGLAESTVENATFTRCHAEGAIVESGEPAANGYVRHVLGGLVGRAKSGTVFQDCSTDSATKVIGTRNALCDLGGFVGHGSNAQFGTAELPCSSEAKLESSAKSTTENPIPDTNLGGFVGISESCAYNKPSVTLPALPEYAKNAGGFAGLLQGGTVDGLTVTINGDDSGESTTTVTNFGGIASTCSGATVRGATVSVEPNILNVKTMAAGAFTEVSSSSTISNVDVDLSGSISNTEKRAGFAITVNAGSSITGSSAESSLGSNSAGFVLTNNGSITESSAEGTLGSNSAGFVLTNNGSITESSAEGTLGSGSAGFVLTNSGSISESYAKGTLGSGSAGFVLTNSGSITRCYANPVMNGGNTFVKTNNNGTVKNCFAWANGRNTNEISGNCSYSYFGTYDDNDSCINMVLYEGLSSNNTSKVSTNITDTAALADIWAVELLNNNNSNQWEKLKTGYPYPSLMGFGYNMGYPDPSVDSYPFALLYEETYTDNTTGVILMKFNSEGKVTNVDEAGLSQDKTIDIIAYYLCHRTDPKYGTATFDRDDNVFADQWKRFGLSGTKELYSIYTLDKDSDYQEGDATSRFPLYDNTGAYRIRTGDQFASIDDDSTFDDSTFYVERDIKITEPLSGFAGNLIGVPGAVITTNRCAVAEMTGGSIKNIIATGIEGNPLVILSKSPISGATHSSGTLLPELRIDPEDLDNFASVTGSQTVTKVDVIDCKIDDVNAVESKIYYYTIEKDLTFEEGTFKEFSTQPRTFQDLVTVTGENGGTVLTFYSNKGTYAYEEVIVTRTEANEENNTLMYTFKFGSDELVLPANSLENNTFDGITLYNVDSSALNLTKCCLLECDNGYLAYDSGIKTIPDTNTLSALWIGNGNGVWTNVGDPTVTITIALSNASNTKLTITCSGTTIPSNTLIATECNPYYACEYLGMNYTMFTPT